MAPTRRRFLGTVTTASAIGLAGCAGDGDADEEPTTETATADETDATATPADGGDGDTAPDGDDGDREGATVSVETHGDLGDILVDGEGRTLYMFDPDEPGAEESTCYDGCADAWPPFTTEADPTADDGVTASLDTFERDDGSRQVSAAGWPLYYFANDAEPGDVNGQGVNGVWWVLGPDGTPKRAEQASVQVASHDEYGDILVDGDGRTLYMFDQDEQGSGSSSCTGGCAEAWPPLRTEIDPVVGDGVEATVETFERDDEFEQVAAGGWPLYYYVQDEEPGDATGQGANDVWWVLAPDGTPQRNDGTEAADSGGGVDTGSGY